MGAERCIVLLVVVVMGTSYFVANSIVDENILKNYSEEIAEYNELHDETLLDTVIRKRNVDDSGLAKEGSRVVGHSNRVRRSSGQGISEDPEQELKEQSYNTRVIRADSDFPRLKSKRSSGQGIDEQPDHTRMERSNGQGIIEDPEHDRNVDDLLSSLRSTQKSVGILSNVERSGKSYPENVRSKRSSGQGINEENADQEVDSSFLETASNLDSDAEEDVGAEDEEFPADNLKSLLNNPSLSELGDISEELSDSDSNAGGEYGEDHIEDIFPVSEQPETKLKIEELIRFQEFETENGNDGDGASHNDNILLNPYEYHYEQSDLSSSDDTDRLLFSFAKDSERIIKLNKGIDFLMSLMNAMFTGEGELTVDLPDISKKFGHGIMAGNFTAAQGYFRNPGTLHRTGDVEITKIADTVSLEVALGLQTLDAGFQHYDLKILKIHQAGAIDLSVAQNSIKMKISLTYAPACNLTVDYVGLDQLGGIKMNISGLGAFQSMFDMLSKWFLDNFTGDLKNVVNQKLAEKAKKAVAREDICKYFPQ